MSPINRRDCLKAGIAAVGATALDCAALAGPNSSEFSFHHDHVLGTSLDLTIAGPDEAAATAAEQVVLGEIERLRLVLSAYDPTSELSRLNRSRAPAPVSGELLEVLQTYEMWRQRTGGAFSGQLGELARVWREADLAGEIPSAETLEQLSRALRLPGWRHDPAAGTVQRTTEQTLNLNALGKVYITGKAAAAVRRSVPAVTGLLLNLGGDLLAWGSAGPGCPREYTAGPGPDLFRGGVPSGYEGGSGWAVGIQDPFYHYDNAAPLAGLRLRNQAVASSGGYQRFSTIGGKRYSHVLDPRTGLPAEGVAGATVVAGDGVAANALATTLCVLTPEQGLRLVAGTPGAECLIIAGDGKRFCSPGLKLQPVDPARHFVRSEEKEENKGASWPAGFQVTVTVELPRIDAKRYRKPYTAIWIEDDKGKPVRTLAVWGSAPKYLKDLNDWWKIGKDDPDLVKAVARATRGPGKYDLVWDGKDGKGETVPQGTYTIRVEVHREYGAHLRQAGKIECLDRAATVKMDKNGETAETVVEFKKLEKK